MTDKAPATLLIEQIARMTLTTETECGQCEGTGTTDAMGYCEECPVCNGTGMIDGGQLEEGAGETLDALIEKAREINGAPCNTPPAIRTEEGRTSMPSTLWEWINETLGDNLVAWQGEEHSVREEHGELIEQLENLSFYIAAHERAEP